MQIPVDPPVEQMQYVYTKIKAQQVVRVPYMVMIMSRPKTAVSEKSIPQ